MSFPQSGRDSGAVQGQLPRETFDAIQKRIAARVTVANACTREIVKLCAGSTKETSKSVPCLVTARASAGTAARPCQMRGINDWAGEARAARYRPAGRRIGAAGRGRPPARAQTAVNRDDIIAQLNRFETAADIDVAALRHAGSRAVAIPIEDRAAAAKAAADRARVDQAAGFQWSTSSSTSTRRSSCRRPIKPSGGSPTRWSIPSLLPYSFLIVGHIDATGRRENNALLSQRRADAVRDVLINTFKIAAKRLQSVGLGRGAIARPGASQCARQQSAADPDRCRKRPSRASSPPNRPRQAPHRRQKADQKR